VCVVRTDSRPSFAGTSRQASSSKPCISAHVEDEVARANALKALHRRQADARDAQRERRADAASVAAAAKAFDPLLSLPVAYEFTDQLEPMFLEWQDRPTPAQLQGREQDSDKQLAAFWALSGHGMTTRAPDGGISERVRVVAESMSPQEQFNMVSEAMKRLDGYQQFTACSACGVACAGEKNEAFFEVPLATPMVKEVFAASAEMLIRHASTPEQYRCALNVYFPPAELKLPPLMLYPKYIYGHKIVLCASCDAWLKRPRPQPSRKGATDTGSENDDGDDGDGADDDVGDDGRCEGEDTGEAAGPRPPPPLSLAAGVNFADLVELHLPRCSIAECMTLGLGRLLVAHLKISVTADVSSTLKGHVCAYAQDGVIQFATSLPNIDLAKALIIWFMGSQRDHVAARAAGKLQALVKTVAQVRSCVYVSIGTFIPATWPDLA
jgi:hypothetical protein